MVRRALQESKARKGPESARDPLTRNNCWGARQAFMLLFPPRDDPSHLAQLGRALSRRTENCTGKVIHLIRMYPLNTSYLDPRNPIRPAQTVHSGARNFSEHVGRGEDCSDLLHRPRPTPTATLEAPCGGTVSATARRALCKKARRAKGRNPQLADNSVRPSDAKENCRGACKAFMLFFSKE